MLANEIKLSPRGMYNTYADWVERVVKVVFLTTNGSESNMVKRTCEITGVSHSTVIKWSRGYYKTNPATGKWQLTDPWLTVKPLQQAFKRKIAIPTCPKECLVLMVKMLWVSHGGHKK